MENTSRFTLKLNAHKFKEDLEFIRSLPKTDLHCHIDGSIRPKTILELAIQDGIDIPTKNLEEFRKHVQVDDSCDSLKDYLKKFELPLKVFGREQNIKRITLELLEDMEREGVKYTELRFSPFLGSNETTPHEKISAVLAGMAEGKEKYGIESRLILCMMRHEPLEKSMEVVQLGKLFKEKGVVGVDLAGNEEDYPPEIHKKAFDLAKKEGFKITIHAGETGKSENIKKALFILKADRIGHGFSVIHDPNLMEYVKREKIPFEICIKSNLDTKGVESLHKHPIQKLFNKGIKVTINTDDITVSKVTIMNEYERLLKVGFSMKDIIKVIKNGIEASFAPEKVKESLLKELNQKSKEYPMRFTKLIKNERLPISRDLTM
jgi:adenosine deaminase